MTLSLERPHSLASGMVRNMYILTCCPQTNQDTPNFNVHFIVVETEALEVEIYLMSVPFLGLRRKGGLLYGLPKCATGCQEHKD